MPRAFILPDLNTLIISYKPYQLWASPYCNTFSPYCCYKDAPTWALITFREVRPKSELSAHTVIYTSTQNMVQLKSKIWHTGAWSAVVWLPAPVLTPGSKPPPPPSSVSRRLHFRKEKSSARFKNVISIFISLFRIVHVSNWITWNSVGRGASVLVSLGSKHLH